MFNLRVMNKKKKAKSTTKNFSGFRVAEFNVPSHSKGGAYLDILGNTTKEIEKAVIEIEKDEVVSKDNNGDFFVYSAKLGSNDIAKEANNIKGDDKIARKTRKLILSDAKRHNLMKIQEEELKAQANNPQVPQAELGADLSKMGTDLAMGGLTSLIPYGIGMVTDSVTDFFTPDPAPIPMQNNTNPFIGKMQNGGPLKRKPKSYANGGPYDLPLDNTQLTTDNLLKFGIPGNNPIVLPNATQSLGRQEMNLPNIPFTATPSNVQSLNATGINSNVLPAEYTNNQYGVPFTDSVTNQQDTSKFNLADALNIGGVIGSAALSFQSPEKEQLQLPNFNRGNSLAGGTGIDPTALINQNQLAYSGVNDASRRVSGTAGQYLNRLRASAGNLAKANDQALLTAKQYNDQTSLQRAGREDRNAMINSQERIRQQTANSQNQAMSQDQMQNFFNQMTSIGNGLDRKKAIEKTTAQMNDNQKRQFALNLATLSMAYPNFKPSGNIKWTIDNLNNLSTDEIINGLIEFRQ